MSVTLRDFVAALQLLIVLVLDAERAADVVHAVLIGRRIVSARRLVTHGVRVLPLGVHITGGEPGAAFVVPFEFRSQVVVPAARHSFSRRPGRNEGGFEPFILGQQTPASVQSRLCLRPWTSGNRRRHGLGSGLDGPGSWAGLPVRGLPWSGFRLPGLWRGLPWSGFWLRGLPGGFPS